MPSIHSAFAATRSQAERLTLLAYHSVPDPNVFAGHVRELARTTPLVSIADLHQALSGVARLPRRTTIVTFDDADRTVLDNAAPVLQHFGVAGIAFVVTGVLDSDTPFWWYEAAELLRSLEYNDVAVAAEIRRLKTVPNQERLAILQAWRARVDNGVEKMPQLRRKDLKALERAGITIGNHTLTHPCLDKCDARTVAREIIQAHEDLTATLGHEPRFFAYPNGNFDARARRVLQTLGYVGAFLFDHRVSRFPPQDPLAISRVRVSATASLARFRLLVSGLHSAVHRLRGLS
jgi:peptidoglycan/xylan/chitin deacetylase (PgdA/CDA1 family)